MSLGQRLRKRGWVIGPYRWWSISLRTCLILTALAAIALGLVGERKNRRDRAVSAIRAVGGSVQTAYRRRVAIQKRFGNLAENPIRDESSPTFSERIFGDTYPSVNIVERPVSKEALSAIVTLSEMQLLNLDATDVADDDIAQLQSLRSLEALLLSKCPISDDSAPVIGRFCELRWLELNKTCLSDRAVPSLMQLTKLEVLRIKDTNITERGILQLASLRNLREIHIGSTDRTASTLPLNILQTLHEKYPHLQVCN